MRASRQSGGACPDDNPGHTDQHVKQLGRGGDRRANQGDREELQALLIGSKHGSHQALESRTLTSCTARAAGHFGAPGRARPTVLAAKEQSELDPGRDDRGHG
jgi:hypothetical protein